MTTFTLAALPSTTRNTNASLPMGTTACSGIRIAFGRSPITTVTRANMPGSSSPRGLGTRARTSAVRVASSRRGSIAMIVPANTRSKMASTRTARADTNDSRIVPGTVLALLAGESPLIRSDGSPVRDYMYVDDAVAAFLALAERLPEPEIAGRAFNFGTNAPVSVLELVELIIESSGRTDIEPTVLSPTKLHGEIDRQYLDSSKARELLGWEARTPLREGIKRTIAWYAADEG